MAPRDRDGAEPPAEKREEDVCYRDQPEQDVLVVGSIHVVTDLVGGQREPSFKPEIDGCVSGSRCRCFWLCQCVSPTIELRAGAS